MKDKGKPEKGKIYRLTGGPNEKSIAQGNTWAESEVDPWNNPEVKPGPLFGVETTDTSDD